LPAPPGGYHPPGRIQIALGRKAEVSVLETSDPGPVESAVAAELHTLRAAADRPGIAAACVALARVLDAPQATHAKPAARA
jgi:hypothetical protein